jgi:hypothetical protein
MTGAGAWFRLLIPVELVLPGGAAGGLHFRNTYPAIDKEWDNRVKGINELTSSDRGFRPGDGGFR